MTKSHRVLLHVAVLLVAAPVLAGAQDQGPTRTQTFRAAPSGADAPTAWGATFHLLEQRATRVTTRFDTGSAVAERAVDGALRTRVFDRAGTERATLRAETTGGLRFERPGASALHTRARDEVTPTLAWANAQAYALHVDGATRLEWRGAVLRGRGRAPIVEQAIETEFADGFVAQTRRGISPTGEPYYFTTLALHGTEVGRMRYMLTSRELVFSFPGLVQDRITPAALASVGGWSFTPTMEWVGVQALGFYHFRTAAKLRAAQQPALPWLARAWNVIVPAVAANEPGCDVLHWLDGTIFRQCCDQHDRCYTINGCTWGSWWWFTGSWSCNNCNTWAVTCFIGGGGGSGDYTWWPTF
jgi:hypothetical protein